MTTLSLWRPNVSQIPEGGDDGHLWMARDVLTHLSCLTRTQPESDFPDALTCPKQRSVALLVLLWVTSTHLYGVATRVGSGPGSPVCTLPIAGAR